MEISRPLAFSTQAISSRLAHSTTDNSGERYFQRDDHENSQRIVGEFQRNMLLFINDKTFSKLMFGMKRDRVDSQAREAPVVLREPALRELTHTCRLQHALRQAAKDFSPGCTIGLAGWSAIQRSAAMLPISGTFPWW